MKTTEDSQIKVIINPDVPPTGNCLGIVNAARKSFGRRSEWDYDYPTPEPLRYCTYRGEKVAVLKEKDKRLLEFLARGMTADDFDEFMHHTAQQGHNTIAGDDYEHYGGNLKELLWQWRNTPTHDTPFNHGFFSFEVKAPIFVARHLVKHEYLIMSEYSRRYITDDVEFYKHTYRNKAGDIKQGSIGLHHHNTEWYKEILYNNTVAMKTYNRMIKDGVAPEQARGMLPQDLMTAWTWSGSFGAFANMVKLRLGKDTQYETRLVAQAVYEELKKQFPVSAPLLVEGVF